MLPPTERFTDRVRDYVRYRPTYPTAVVDLLHTACDIPSGAPIADVGAGTGIFSSRLLDAGYEVFAVEPNDAMRAAAEAQLGSNARFHSLEAPADATTLPDHSVAAVTVAQAWHWFAGEAARREFVRILQPGGWLLLVWNERETVASTPFLQAYEAFLKAEAPEYMRVRHREFDAKRLDEVFAPEPMQTTTFPNHQVLDRDGLLGRVLSSSYAPNVGQTGHERFVAKLHELFEAFHTDGHVVFSYETQVYWGRLR